jgi:hypothetical protein
MSETAQALEKQLAELESQSGAASQPWDAHLVTILALGLLVFSIVVLVIGAVLLWRKDADGLTILKLFGLTLIVSLSAFLMIVGYGQNQLTPVVGLFGAIAGYLLGKEKDKT